MFAGQVKKFLLAQKRCVDYIGKTNEFQGFIAEAIRRTSRSDFDLPSSVLSLQHKYNQREYSTSQRVTYLSFK